MNFITSAAIVATASAAAIANDVEVAGGQTSVILDFDTLAAAASLEFSSVSSDVIAPGSLEGSVALPTRSRDVESLPTTLAYEAGDFVGFIDILGFINAFLNQDLAADFDGDGMISYNDVSLFVDAYPGCRSFSFGH